MKTIKIILFLFLGHFIFAQDSSVFTKSYEYENQGKYTEAIQTIKTIYKEDSYAINLRLGWLHYSAGLFSEATTYYQKSIALMPYSIEAKFGLILPQKALGNWNAVKAQYEAILRIDHQNTVANYNIGLIHYGQKKYKTALSFFEKVTNLYPFDFNSTLMMAWSHLQLGNFRESKILFNHALLIQPSNTSAQEGLALIK